MGHPNTIFVTNLFDMPRHVRELRPARVVSIIQPEFQPERPPEISEQAHLRVGVHDIIADEHGGILFGEHDMRELIAFLEAWDPAEGALLTHCFAGVSRSTATALIAHYMQTGDAAASAVALRAAAPHALPNTRITGLADELLGCGGALLEASKMRDSWTPPLGEGPLTTLRF